MGADTHYPSPKLRAAEGGKLVLRAAAAAGEELFAIPRSRILTAETVRKHSDFLDVSVDAVASQLPPRSLWLQLWLSYERHRADSPHNSYLASLPTAFHLPFLWSPTERVGLRASWLGPAVEDDVHMVEQTYERHLQPLCRSAPEHWPVESCSRATWRWAWAVVWSRALGIPTRESVSSSENGLIPLLDLANHDSRSTVTGRWVPSRGEFVVVAGTALAAGVELTLNYNNWGSAEMLQHYGFVHLPHAQWRSHDDTIDLEPTVLVRPAATSAQRCQLAWLLRQAGSSGAIWAGWEESCGVDGWHLRLEQLPPLTISDPSAAESSVLQRMMIAMGTRGQLPLARCRPKPRVWYCRALPDPANVQRLQLHRQSTRWQKPVWLTRLG